MNGINLNNKTRRKVLERTVEDDVNEEIVMKALQSIDGIGQIRSEKMVSEVDIDCWDDLLDGTPYQGIKIDGVDMTHKYLKPSVIYNIKDRAVDRHSARLLIQTLALIQTPEKFDDKYHWVGSAEAEYYDLKFSDDKELRV